MIRRRFRVMSVKLSALLSVLLAAVMLTACGASVTYYEERDKGVDYCVYELRIERETLEAMENSAATDADGNRYKVADYLSRLLTDFGYELMADSADGSGYTAKYRKPVSDTSELFRIGTAPEFKTDHSENPFVRTVHAQSPNPYNGVRAYYDSIAADDGSTVIGRLKNGLTVYNEHGEKTEVFPSLFTAFPYIKGLNPDGLTLNYKRTGSSRMTSSGVAVKLDGKTSEYTFTRYFDTSDTNIAFEYNRPVPYGWYLTAVAAGVLTLAVFAAVTRKSKINRAADTPPKEGGDTVQTKQSEGDENNAQT